MGRNPSLNPAPDSYGDKGVWTYLGGMLNQPSTFRVFSLQFRR